MPKKTIVFVTPEIAIAQELHTYSGGLGVVAGDMARSAYKLGIPIVVVTLLPRFGYYDQGRNENGMTAEYIPRYYEQILEDTGLMMPINICSKLNWVKVLKLPPERYGTVPIYFLDADIQENDYLARKNTQYLYGGIKTEATQERSIAQSIILGKGAVKAMRRLKIMVDKYHFNESHTAFGPLEILSGLLKEKGNLEEAISTTKAKTVFTTHTPVDNGNPKYDLDLVASIMGLTVKTSLNKDILRSLGGNVFDMAAVCLKLSGISNAVSKKHLQVAQRMWGYLGTPAPLVGVTNGVSQDFWQYPEFRAANTPEQMAAAKMKYKTKFIEKINKDENANFNPNISLGVWARRLAEYKRPKLLFDDLEWLSHLLVTNQLQLIIAGKPHHDDDARIEDWNYIFHLSKNKEKFPNLVVLPGFELELNKRLKGAADLWINTPRSPLEACGTSGMSAAMNGAINISTPDGWMPETNPRNCFLFGSATPMPNVGTQDRYDAAELRTAVGNALTMYYHDQDEWSEIQLLAKLEVEKKYTSDRMIKEYALLYDL